MGGRQERGGSPESRVGLPIGDEDGLGEIGRRIRSEEYLTERKLARAVEIALGVLLEKEPGTRPTVAPPKPPGLGRR